MRTVDGSHFDFRRLFTGAIRFGAGAAAIISTSPSGFGAAAPPRAVDLVRMINPWAIGGWDRLPRVYAEAERVGCWCRGTALMIGRYFRPKPAGGWRNCAVRELVCLLRSSGVASIKTKEGRPWWEYPKAGRYKSALLIVLDEVRCSGQEVGAGRDLQNRK